MCDIWKRGKLDEIGPDCFDRQLADLERLGVEWVVFSGGEPLLHTDLFRKAAELRHRGIRVTLLSSGLLLGRFAGRIVSTFDDVIVSLDGPRGVHDRIRDIPRAFDLLGRGVARIHSLRPAYRVSARCTVQRHNCGHLAATVDAARGLGLSCLSFLAADIHSTAFNRSAMPIIRGSNPIAPDVDDLRVLDSQIEQLIDSGACFDYVLESPEKLRRIAHHFRSCLGLTTPRAPLCNAPWTSAVIEADGAVRPCFFHREIGRLDQVATLADILNGPDAIAFRSGLKVESNPICANCVCSLNWKTGEGQRA
jgi:MoaA/NifB/PqqE/SkfB family radical SAM enzyme